MLTCPVSTLHSLAMKPKHEPSFHNRCHFVCVCVCVGAVHAGGDLVPETARIGAGRGSQGDDSKTEEHQPHQGEHGALHSQPV